MSRTSSGGSGRPNVWGEDGAPPAFLIEVRAGGPAGGCHTNPGQLCRWPEAHGRGSEPRTAVALGRRGWRSLFLTDGRGMWKEEITGDGQGPGRWDRHQLSGDGAPGEHAGDSELLQSSLCGSVDQLAFSGTKRNASSNRWRLRLDKEPLAVTSPRLHRCCPARRSRAASHAAQLARVWHARPFPHGAFLLDVFLSFPGFLCLFPLPYSGVLSFYPHDAFRCFIIMPASPQACPPLQTRALLRQSAGPHYVLPAAFIVHSCKHTATNLMA